MGYDVAVVGGGPGGYVAALRAALRGASVCLVERGPLGGTCLNVGCIPTKAMLHASELFHQFGRAKEYGLKVSEASVDAARFMKRVAGVVAGLRNGVEGLLKARKVEVIRGVARLAGPGRLTVETGGETREIQARAILLATGSRPARPGFVPWDSPHLLTTDQATTAKGLPESVVVIGGGVIGCEFATVYAELGIPTTVVEMLDRLVPNLDDDASNAVRASLERRGADVRTGAKIGGMQATKRGVAAELDGGRSVEAAAALVAVGRAPNVEDLGLDAAGVELQDGVIRADERCRTNVDGVYAVGDCAERLQYAHLASRMGVVAADNATGHAARDARRVVPVGVYTHPEVAAVGASEADASRSGAQVRVARFAYQASGMARAYGDPEGGVKIVADADTGEILGATVIGPHATDVVQELALAMRNELTVEEVADTIHPHPTFVEGVLEAAEGWLGLPMHSLG